MGNNRFDLLSLGEILLRLSPPDNERIVSGETFQKEFRFWGFAQALSPSCRTMHSESMQKIRYVSAE